MVLGVPILKHFRVVDELYRNRMNTIRNPDGTLANRRVAGFSLLHPSVVV